LYNVIVAFAPPAALDPDPGLSERPHAIRALDATVRIKTAANTLIRFLITLLQVRLG
jgi:hypothetical protein